MAQSKTLGCAEAVNDGIRCATIVKANGHEMIADEMEDVGGGNLGPSPMDYLCMSLASCKAITLRMYAQRKHWEIDTIHVKVDFIYNGDAIIGTNTFHCQITVTGKIDEAQQKRLQEIAKICPVSRVLLKQNEVVTNVSGI